MVGELLLTAAVLLGLFLGWKLWWFDGITAANQTAAADTHLRTWGRLAATPAPRLSPPVAREPSRPSAVIGVLRIGRFGADYARTIAQGTTEQQLSTFQLGIGHYPGTAMPGGVGNFAVAGHRSAYGGAMHLLDQLRPGDEIDVDTPAGRYIYAYRGIRTVLPSARGVIAAVPDRPTASPTERLITLTTCTPLYSTAYRLVAVGVLTGFVPRVGG